MKNLATSNSAVARAWNFSALWLTVGCLMLACGSTGGGTGGGSAGAGGSTGGGRAGGAGGAGGNVGGGAGGGGTAGGGGSGGLGGGTAGAGGSVGGGTAGAGGSAGAGGGTAGSGGDAGIACPHPPGPVDAPRAVVVSHPYPDDGGNRDDRYEVFELASDGGLRASGQSFRMRRTFNFTSPISFTPDGRLGFVAQDDGTVGIFRVSTTGAVTVVNPAYQAGFRASTVYVDPTGAYLYVLDFNTVANGGAVHRVALDCDGTPLSSTRVLTGDTPAQLAFLHSGTHAIIAATTLNGSDAGENAYLASLTGTFAAVVSSAAPFPDRNSLASHVAVNANDSRVAISDNGLLGGDRIAVLSLNGTTLTPQRLLATPAPAGLAWSPFGPWGFIVNTDGADHYRVLREDAGVSAPLAYRFGRPELPGRPILLERGALTGRVLVAELEAIRQFQFERDGGLSEVSKLVLTGVGSGATIGTMGVAP